MSDRQAGGRWPSGAYWRGAEGGGAHRAAVPAEADKQLGAVAIGGSTRLREQLLPRDAVQRADQRAAGHGAGERDLEREDDQVGGVRADGLPVGALVAPLRQVRRHGEGRGGSVRSGGGGEQQRHQQPAGGGPGAAERCRGGGLLVALLVLPVLRRHH